MDDDGETVKLNHANIDDEFLQHPYSRALIRNPFLETVRPVPIRLSSGEYAHNCLDEALGTWHCVCVSESSFRDMLNGPRAEMGKLHGTLRDFDFAVTLRKSTYVPPRKERKMPGKDANRYIDKANIGVVDAKGGLRVEIIEDGLVATWNRAHPILAVRTGDQFIRVNEQCIAAGMIEELQMASDLRIRVRRSQADRRLSSERRARAITSAGAAITSKPR